MRETRMSRMLGMLLLVVLLLCIAQVAFATSVVGNGNAFVPNANYGSTTTSGTTTQPTSSSNTDRDTRFMTAAELAALGASGTTGTTGTINGTQTTTTTSTTATTSRDTKFMTPQEVATQTSTANTTAAKRDTAFLVAGETPNIPTTNNGRSKSFLVAGEVPRDINGNPLVTATSAGTATSGTRIGNCREWVNVRESDSTKAKIVGKAYLNESVSIQRWNSKGTWAYISFSGGNGWVNGSFIKK